MNKLIKINGKSYQAADFDVNMLCDFTDDGIDLGQMKKYMPKVARYYVAACMGADLEEAGAELTEHCKKSGGLIKGMEDIFSVFSEAVEESGFFPSDEETTEETTPKSKSKKKSESEDVIS